MRCDQSARAGYGFDHARDEGSRVLEKCRRRLKHGSSVTAALSACLQVSLSLIGNGKSGIICISFRTHSNIAQFLKVINLVYNVALQCPKLKQDTSV